MIGELSLEQPAFGQTRLANEIRRRGHSISPAGVSHQCTPAPSHPELRAIGDEPVAAISAILNLTKG